MLDQRDYSGGAWGFLVVFVVVWDLFAIWSQRTVKLKRHHHSTLSTRFYLWITAQHANGKKHWKAHLLIYFWCYLTAHLFKLLPKKYDLFRVLT